MVEAINGSGASFLVVCLGAPKQEKWIAAHKNELRVRLAGGFGGSIDIFAGNTKRAPKIFVRLGLSGFTALPRNRSASPHDEASEFVFGTVPCGCRRPRTGETVLRMRAVMSKQSRHTEGNAAPKRIKQPHRFSREYVKITKFPAAIIDKVALHGYITVYSYIRR